jgi:hypothetical protein
VYVTETATHTRELQMKVYIVQALGWGNDEDHWENIAAYSSKEQAEKKIDELTKEWLDDNGNTDGLELQIEELA